MYVQIVNKKHDNQIPWNRPTRETKNEHLHHAFCRKRSLHSKNQIQAHLKIAPIPMFSGNNFFH